MSILCVFDIDGTITDTVEMHREAFKYALQYFGVNTATSAFVEFEHHTDYHIAKVLLEQVGVQFNREIIEQFEAILLEHLSTQGRKIEPISGVLTTLEQLSAHQEIDLVYGTGSFFTAAIHKLEKINLSIEQDNVFASNTRETRESIVLDSIQHAQKKYNIDQYDHVVAFGDGLWDQQTAKNLDLAFVGIGNEYKEELITRGCQYHLESFDSFSIDKLISIL